MNRISLDICALDPSVKEHAARGIGRYVRELKAYFDGVKDKEAEVTYFNSVHETKNHFLSRAVDFLPMGRATVRQQLLYPWILKSQESHAQFLHFPAHMDAPTYCKLPTIVTVLDCIPWVLKELYAPEQPSWKFTLARFLEERAIRNARHLIAISECTKKDIVNIFRIPPEKISVTPLGVSSQFFEDSAPTLSYRRQHNMSEEEKLFLYVGGIDKRKNIPLSIKAFNEVIKEFPNSRFLIAGKISEDKNYPELVKLVDVLGIKEKVHFLGFVPDEQLKSLFKEVDVFLFPSLYEGFGLPPLEALASGCVVASSSTSCMKEFLGDVPLYFNPREIQSMVHVMKEALSLGDDQRKHRIELGKAHAQNFTWKRTGDATLLVYKSIV